MAPEASVMQQDRCPTSPGNTTRVASGTQAGIHDTVDLGARVGKDG